MTEPTYHRAPDGTLFEKVDGRVRAIYDERGPAVNESYGAAVKNGELLVELAAREAGRRKHKAWKKVSALDLIAVLKELGFKMVIVP